MACMWMRGEITLIKCIWMCLGADGRLSGLSFHGIVVQLLDVILQNSLLYTSDLMRLVIAFGRYGCAV